VVLGVALSVVGAGLTLSAFFEPGASPLTSVNPLAAPNLQPGHPLTKIVWLQNTSSGTLALNWVASSNVNVSLYKAVDCAFLGVGAGANYCPAGSALALWPSNASGHWNISGEISAPYLLNLQNPGPKSANLSAVFDEVWPSSSPGVPTWIFVSALAGGVACISLGAVAVFLGLFLRSGVYSRTPSEDLGDDEGGSLANDPEDDFEDDDPPGDPPD
jgi:hypothetical protein